MNIINLSDKRPEHQHISRLRRAVRKMQTSIDEQKVMVAEFQGNLGRLENVMGEMEGHFSQFNQNLGSIKISVLGDEARKLVRITVSARA